ncbi:MAG: NADH-quinone oxidoreductase subunit M [Proteobacteria bacterium]|nr:NADH-quinone oxidoreductase subunit M [Pseudomonadota bacterium]
MFDGLPLLSLAIWVPIVAGILVLLTGRDSSPCLSRWLALAGSLAGFLVTVPLFTGFNATQSGMQFEEFSTWIPAFNINYHLGVDGISMLLILLTSFTTVLVVIAGWQVIQKKVAQYMASFLILSGLMIGVFASMDAILFYVFWEAQLIPMFLIIGVWGGPNRVYATIKFFLYTLLGSLLMLISFIYMYHLSGSFDIKDLQNLPLTMTVQVFIFISFFLSFAVKLPMWPVHTWLPDAHVEAPTGGSVVLAAIMLKMGGYGFIRLAMPIAPDAAHALSGVMIFLSLMAIIYISFVALVQTDMKKLIAYSSIAHMGFVTLGLFIFNIYGFEGAVLQMISHGFVSAALFLCVGVMYDRLHSRLIADYGGIANSMPVFAAFFMLFAMANAGLPGTSAFTGEFTVILGTIQSHFWYAALAATTLITGAAYTLWMYKRVVFGEVVNQAVSTMQDLNAREIIVLGLLAVAVLGMGLYPFPVTHVMQVSAHNLLTRIAQSKLH